ncbi:MAG: stress response translation initiation inhibitor YciH [Fibrobacteres bacterium]|nr:stress response translation initiation inhibitor YciH [Fibrobacterota bacterium]
MDGQLVYSTGQGRIRSEENKPVAPAPSGNGVRVSRETKGRKGKGVTIVTGLSMNFNDINDLARFLKQRCASGGTVNEGIIEIQGDHRDTILKLLNDKGINAKKSGG